MAVMNLNLQQLYSYVITFVDFEPDGSTLDTTEALTYTLDSGPGSILVESVPGSNRKLKFTANGAAGARQVKVTAPGVPPGNETTINFTVTAPPPNLSHVDIQNIEGPFAPPP